MAHHRVLKALSNDNTITKIGPFALTWRQVTIVVLVVAPFYVAYAFLEPLLPIGSWTTVAIFAPAVVLAFIIAFVPTTDGRHVEWHVVREWVLARNPSTFFWRSKASGLSPRELRASVQSQLPHEEILWHLARTTDGNRYMALKVFRQPSIVLAGPEEKELRWRMSVRMLNTIDFPLTEILDSRESTTSPYVEELRARLLNDLGVEDENLALFAAQHLHHVQEEVDERGFHERIGYIILAYNPLEADAPEDPLTRLWSTLKPFPDGSKVKNAQRLQEQDEISNRILIERVQLLVEAYAGMEIGVRPLYGPELLSFLTDQISGEEAEEGEDLSLVDTVTLHDRPGYGKLPGRRQRELLDACEPLRNGSPPAIGTGFLEVSDRVAPSVLEIERDHVRVGNSYRSTFFVKEWPNRIQFGHLGPLLKMRGRVKIIKRLIPLDQNTAANLFGRRLAETSAAGETGDSGNVVERVRRSSTENDALQSVEEIVSERQRAYMVSLIIHCVADSPQELRELEATVSAKMRATGTKLLPCTKEQREGWESSLPCAPMKLTRRYAEKAMLTEPLADLQLFMSHQINHPGGIYLGMDYTTGAPVHLNTRQQSNPHMVIIGVPGAGKSVTVKAYATRLFLQGELVVILDPRGESKYRRVAAAMGGQYVTFGVGSRDKFNPFDIKGYVNLQLLRGLEEDSDGSREALDAALVEAQRAALDGKIRFLIRLVSEQAQNDAGKGELTSKEEGLVDELLRETYASKGIYEDPTTHDNVPPVFPDFYRLLQKAAETNPALQDLVDRLRIWITGANRTLFDSQTNVDLSSKFLCFHIARLDGREKATTFLALQDFLTIRCSDPDEPATAIDDEGWDLLKYKKMADERLQQYRLGRAQNLRQVMATQDVSEFMGSEAGQTILRISETILALRQKREPLEKIEGIVPFSEEQKNEMPSMPDGHGHLFVADSAVPIKISISEQELRLFNTDPEQEKRYREEEAAEGHEVGAIEAMRRDTLEELPVGEVDQDQGGVLSNTGKVRRFLAQSDEDAIPQPGDFVVDPEGSSEGQGSDDDPTLADPDRLVLKRRDPHKEAPLWTVAGGGAGPVAYNLAGFLAVVGRSTSGAKVLLVDADDYISSRILPGVAESPDPIIEDPSRPVSDTVCWHEDTGLSVVLYPANEDIDAESFLRRCRNEYDLVIVAAGTSLYSVPWIREADRAMAAGGAALEKSLQRVERLRGADGTLLVPMGQVSPTPYTATKKTYPLPAMTDRIYRETERESDFASLQEDSDVARTAESLARELLGSPVSATEPQAEPHEPHTLAGKES